MDLVHQIFRDMFHISSIYTSDIVQNTRDGRPLLIISSSISGEDFNTVSFIWVNSASWQNCAESNSIAQSQFYAWNKEFMEAGKLASERGCDQRSNSDEVSELKKENARLKEMVADLVLRYDIVKKSLDMLD